MNKEQSGGFTLVEMLVVIGLIALLSGVVLVAVNPSRQFKLARDSERGVYVGAILNAIGQNMAENKGVFTCDGSAVDVPSASTTIKSGGGFDIAECLVPIYLAKLPYDPSKSTAHFSSAADYDTGYVIFEDSDGHLTVSAESEITSGAFISATR